MRKHFTYSLNRFTVIVALLLSLTGSMIHVVPVQAAAILVNSYLDTIVNDGKCTLREAIIAANFNTSSGSLPGECVAGSSAGVDTIGFADKYTITLQQQLPFVISSITISGRGAGDTIIQAAGGPNVATWRVFQITTAGSLALEGLTVRNGRCDGSCTAVGGSESSFGGGVFNQGSLTLKNCVISGNTASGWGGAIYNTGTLSVAGSSFSGNTSNWGGGVFNSGVLTITNSTFYGNTVFKDYFGGIGAGILNYEGGALTITSSTFSSNSAETSGGGIFNLATSGSLTVANSTFSGNSALYGGGILNYIGGILTVTNCTIVGNSATEGGGIHSGNEEGLASLKNTIVANNIGENCYGFIDNGGNNLDSGTTCGWGISVGSLSNTDPLLGPLASNGGPTQTMKLMPGSPAVDSGSVSSCNASPVNGVDQRGVKRPLGNKCDMGAYETSNGDGPDTVGVFRPSNGVIFLKNLNISGYADLGLNYGMGGDYPVVGDWDGNGTDTIGVYRSGVFLLRNSNSIGFANLNFAFGQIGDQPIAGDWDGDGDDTVGVYRPSTGVFYLRNTNSAGAPDITFSLGNVGDVGIAGDWNNDGIDTTGVFRPINGIIFLKNTNTSGFADVALNYGITGDKPVVGDWDDNGTATIGVYRNAKFYLRNSNTNGYADIILALGIPGDMPIAGNWDGNP